MIKFNQNMSRLFAKVIFTLSGTSWMESYLIWKNSILIYSTRGDDVDVKSIKNSMPLRCHFSLKAKLVWAVTCLANEKPFFLATSLIGLVFCSLVELLRAFK